MQLYTHSGDGKYIGSTIIVLAKSFKTAEKLIRYLLDNNGLPDERVQITNIEKIKESMIPITIYVNNGDY